MSRYSKYFLQHLLWLDDGQCRYYVQDPRLCHNDILDVPVVVYDQERDAEQMLLACMAHNTFWVIDRLRGFLSEDCHGYHFVYKMADHEVVRAAAGELTHRAFQVVIEPGNGWAVRTDDVTDQPLVPVAVEPASEVEAVFEELRQALDDLVAEQRKKYEQYEAELAGRSEAEQAAVYGKKAAGSVWEATVGGLVETVKALPGFYKGYLKTLRKIALYPSQLGAVTAECIATGSMGPLKAEIDKVVKPLASTWEEAWKYESILCVLLTDLQTLELLQDFAERYYDTTHPLELAEMGASAASDIVVTVLLAIFTAGVGAAANVAARSTKLVKVAKLLERLARMLKRVGHRHKLPKKEVPGAVSEVKKKGKKAGKGVKQDKSGLIRQEAVNGNPSAILRVASAKNLSKIEFETPKEAYSHINSLKDDVGIVSSRKLKGLSKSEAGRLKKSVREGMPVEDYPGIDYKEIDKVLENAVDKEYGVSEISEIKNYVFKNKDFEPPLVSKIEDEDLYRAFVKNKDNWSKLIDGNIDEKSMTFLNHEYMEMSIKKVTGYDKMTGMDRMLMHEDIHGSVLEVFDTQI